MSKYGSGIFPKASKRLVLSIELLETDDKDQYNITWAEICNKTRHPLKNEITDHYLWKEKNGQ